MMRIINGSNTATSELFASNYGVRGFCGSRNYIGLEIRFLRLQKPCPPSGSLSKSASQLKNPIFPLRSSSSSEPQVEYETTEAELPIYRESKTVHVKLQLQKECQFGEKFFLVGDDPMLGLWDPLVAIPMNWSEGHLWTAELDVPVGKLIQFKFILKDTFGETLWQPGPDRVLHTWETKNTISVLEDWENMEIQHVMEEEKTEEESYVSNIGLAVTDEFSQPTQDSMTQQSYNLNGSVDEVQQPMLEPTESPGAAQSLSGLDDEQPSMFADSFIAIHSANNTFLHGEQTTVSYISIRGDRTLQISETVTAEYIHKFTEKQPVAGLNRSMMEADEIPVLIPGLPPSTMSTEIPTVKEDKEESEDDSSNKTSARRNAPESDQTQETKRQSKSEETSELNISDKYQQEMSTETAITNAEELLDKRPDTTTSAENEDAANSDQTENDILHNDLKWGRETLQKLLTSLRFI